MRIATRIVRRLALGALGTSLALFVTRVEPARATKHATVAAFARADSRLWIEMRNVDMHVNEQASMHLRSVRGEVISTKAGAPAILDDAKSFSIRVTSGTIALDGDGLAALLNQQVFNYPGAPLEHIRVRIENSHVIQSGTLHKGVDVPFEVTGVVSLEPDGRIRVHPIATKMLGIDGGALLHALGLHLDKLLDLSGARGISVKGDDLFLEPTKILPPPGITGRLSSIRVDGNLLVQDFVRLPDDSVFEGSARPDSAAMNYINFHGGRLQFGKLLMSDTDLQIVDADERDPLDLNLAEYAKQLVAGSSHTLADQGLRVLMPDYRAVKRGPPAVAAVAHAPR